MKVNQAEERQVDQTTNTRGQARNGQDNSVEKRERSNLLQWPMLREENIIKFVK